MALASGAGFSAITIAGPAYAQHRTFDVPAQTAVRSIPEFASQAGLQIIAPAERLIGVSTPAVKGDFDVHEALERLLAGTGFMVASDSGEIVTLRRAPEQATAVDNGEVQSGRSTPGRQETLAPPPDQHRIATRTVGSSAGPLEELLVTARRVEERGQSAPISVTAISSQRLKALNIDRIEGIDTIVPNLLISDAPANGMGTIVYIRGIGAISVSSYSDPPISIYVDGVVQARPVGNAFELPDVDQVEVLRGPQGTLFGRNTTGGAIAIYTKKPAQDFGGSAEFGYGNYNEVSSQLVLNTGELGQSGWRAKATLHQRFYDGYVDTFGVARSDWVGYYRAASGSFVLAKDFDDRLAVDNRIYVDFAKTKPGFQTVTATPQALAFFGPSASRGGGPFLVSSKPLDLIYLDPRRAYDPEATAWGDTLTLTYDVNDRMSLKSITGYRGLRQKQTGQTGGSSVVGPVGTPTNFVPALPAALDDRMHEHQASEELQATGELGALRYVLGLYYFNEEAYESLSNSTPSLLPDGLAALTAATTAYSLSSTSYASYGDLSYKPAAFDDRLELNGGLRFTDDDKSEDTTRISNGIRLGRQIAATSWGNLGGSLGASYQWTDDVMTYVRLSSAYRAGGFNPSQIGASPYGPENAKAVELGFKTEWLDRRVRLNGAIFKTFYDNLQISQRNFQTTLTMIANAGKATFTGFELEGEAAVSRCWRVFGSVGYIDPKYQQFFFKDANGLPVNYADVARFPLVSRWTYNIGVQYQTPLLRFGVVTAVANYAYQSSHYFQPIDALAPNNAANPSGPSRNLTSTITVSDMPISTGPLKNVRLQAYADNLLDNRYREIFIDYGFIGSASFNRPRSFGMRLLTDF
jgi:iron complex outermembrane receptor protein